MFGDKSLQHFALIAESNPWQCITLPLFSVEGLQTALLGIVWYGNSVSALRWTLCLLSTIMFLVRRNNMLSGNN